MFTFALVLRSKARVTYVCGLFGQSDAKPKTFVMSHATFPRFSYFVALVVRCMFSRAFHLAFFPLAFLRPVACFPALVADNVFTRAFHRSNVSWFRVIGLFRHL